MMLLFGVLLLSAALAAAQADSENIRVKVCIQEGKVKSVELREDDETLTSDCSDLHWEYDGNSKILLRLDRRNISGFESGWYRLQGVQFRAIDLSYNEISEITSEMLNDLPLGIVEVNLNRNKIERLRGGVINNGNLMGLLLSNNNINEIESGALENVQLLKLLHLRDNQLTNTEFAATLPQNLMNLELSYNAITEISAGSFSTLRELRMLGLGSNSITELRQHAFQGLEKLSYLDLSKNPIENVENGTFEFNSIPKENMIIRIDEAHREEFGL